MHVQNVIIIEKRYCDFILCLIDLIFFEYMFKGVLHLKS